MDFIQSGEVPEISEDSAEKVIRTNALAHPHALFARLDRLEWIGFGLILLVWGGIAGLISLFAPVLAAVFFALGLGVVGGLSLGVIISGRVQRKARWNDSDYPVVYEFRQASVTSRRSDGTLAFRWMKNLYMAVVMYGHVEVYFEPDRVNFIAPHDLEHPEDWAELVDWFVKSGTMNPKNAPKALALAKKSPL